MLGRCYESYIHVGINFEVGGVMHNASFCLRIHIAGSLLRVIQFDISVFPVFLNYTGLRKRDLEYHNCFVHQSRSTCKATVTQPCTLYTPFVKMSAVSAMETVPVGT